MHRCLRVILCLSLVVVTRVVASDGLVISDATIRLPLPGQTTAVVYLQLYNGSGVERWVEGVAVEGAAASELHQHVHRDGMMRMRAVERIAIAPGAKVIFESGGYHIMAFRMTVSQPVAEQFQVKLMMADGQFVTAQATPVR